MELSYLDGDLQWLQISMELSIWSIMSSHDAAIDGSRRVRDLEIIYVCREASPFSVMQFSFSNLRSCTFYFLLVSRSCRCSVFSDFCIDVDDLVLICAFFRAVVLHRCNKGVKTHIEGAQGRAEVSSYLLQCKFSLLTFIILKCYRETRPRSFR
ncbi:hypothetical protein L484_004644 [Morus notabilis]|uniref:Uncharacterized protein n=1 Tax=Morus notabilis TaxID=981085 RepID=W9RHP5_9ROSA|nr:hypothetical protein L484_004644 [Morus notabilis]